MFKNDWTGLDKQQSDGGVDWVSVNELVVEEEERVEEAERETEMGWG